MLGDCTGEILTLELFLGIGLANKSKSQFWLQITIVAKWTCWVRISYVQRWALCCNYLANVYVSLTWVEVVDRSHRNCLPLPLLPCKSWMFGKENPNRTKCTLGESRHRGFLGFLVVDNSCYIFLSVRQAAFWENYALAFCWETYSEVWQGKPRGAMVSDKINL